MIRLKSKLIAAALAAVMIFCAAVPEKVSASESDVRGPEVSEVSAGEIREEADEPPEESSSGTAATGSESAPAEIKEEVSEAAAESTGEPAEEDAEDSAEEIAAEGDETPAQEAEMSDSDASTAQEAEISEDLTIAEENTAGNEDASGSGTGSTSEISSEHAAVTEPEKDVEKTAAGAEKKKTKEAPEEAREFSEEKKAGEYIVRIRAKAGVFPAGTKVNIEEMSGSAAKPYAEKAEEMAKTGVVTAVFDISFTDSNGKEIQPEGMVEIVFENTAEDESDMSVYHAKESNAAKMEEIPAEVEGEDIKIMNDSFSPYIILAAAGEPDWTKGGRGTSTNVSDLISIFHRDQRVYYYEDFGYSAGDETWMTMCYDMSLNGRSVGQSVCLDPLKNGWEMEGVKAGKVYEISAPMLVKALYYGSDGPGSDVIKRIVGTDDKGALNIVTHVAASEIYARLGYSSQSSSGDGFRDASNQLKDHVYRFVKAIEDLSVPGGFYAYVTADNGYAQDGTGNQDFGFVAASLVEHPGSAEVKKASSDPYITEGNSCYSLKGARYWAYTSEAAAKKRTEEGFVKGAIFVTDEKGVTNVINMDPGTYYMIEGKASKGFLRSDEVIKFTVSEGKTTQVDAIEIPGNDPTAIVINKKSRNGDKENGFSPEGTEFTVNYYGGYYDAASLPAKADRTWVIKALKTESGLFKAVLDKEHLVSGDDFYSIGGHITLPLGTVTIRETKAAEGFINDGKFGDADMYIGQIRINDEATRVQMVDVQGKRGTDNSFEVLDTPSVPVIGTTAADKASGTHLARCGSEVTIEDTVTYKNLAAGREYTLSGRFADKLTGETLKDADGNEITAQTVFTAQPGEGSVIVPFTFRTDSSFAGKAAVVFETLQFEGRDLVSHADINDEKQTIRFPGVKTNACDKNTGKKNTLASKDRVIVDRITYSGLIPGETYEITGEVRIKQDDEQDFDKAEKVPSVIVGARGEGNVTFDDAKVTFIPSGDEGTEVSGELLVSFKIDASELAGEKLVAGETIRYKGADIAVHRDLSDKNQTVFIPRGQTTAIDTDTGIKNTLAAENRVIRDVFSYENLLPGEKYRFTGKVMALKETDADGRNVMEEIPSVMTDEKGIPVESGFVEFVPQNESGTLDLYFSIDASLLADRDVTVYEKVTLGGEPVIIHEELDGTQTVYIPEGSTMAADSKTRDRISRPEGEVTLIDTFVYKNLIPGTEYTLKGRIMKKSSAQEMPSTLTGAEFKADGRSADSISGEISVSDNTVTFTPDSEDGTLELTFAFDGSSLCGEDVVVFERAYHNGAEVIVHENIDDEFQTISLPDGRTTASDPDTGSHTVPASTAAKIRDRFYYKNLIPGKEYVITGKVMLKPSAGEKARELRSCMVDASGKEVKEWRFTPASEEGYEDVFFTVNAKDLAGHSAVVFETLAFVNTELNTVTAVVVHEDIDDSEQTIHFPQVRTTAADKADGDKMFSHEGTVRIEDKVEYRNLMPGMKYRVRGVLMKKTSGSPAKTGGKEITGEAVFTAKESDGSVPVIFSFDSSGLEDGEYVVFETLYEISDGTGAEKEVASHRDLRDASQTVRRKTPPGEPGTGDSAGILVPIVVMAAAIAGIITVILEMKMTGK